MQRRSSLKFKLRQSVLLTTGLSLFLLALALVLIAWLGRDALHLARIKAPTVRHTERLHRSVQESQEDLLSWVANGEERARHDRKELWNKEIIPSLNELLTISTNWTKEERLGLLAARDKIYELEGLQWWAEDSAHAIGNQPAVHLYGKEIRLVFTELQADLSILSEWLAASEAGSPRPNLGRALGNLRGSSSAAHVAFAEFLLSREQEALEQCRGYFDRANGDLTVLRENRTTLPDGLQKIAERIEFSLLSYQKQLTTAAFLAQSRDADQARALIAEHIRPTIDVIRSKLEQVDERELASLAAGARTVESLIWLAMIGLPLFMVATGFVAVRNSGQFHSGIVAPINELAVVAEAVNEGDYGARIERDSDDEIGLLAAAFNNMIDSFRKITEVAMAVACGDFSRRLEVAHEKDPLRNAINAMNSKLVEIKAQAQRIARGDYSNDFVPMSEQDELGLALKQMTINLRESRTLLASSEARSSAVIRTARDGIITIGDDSSIHSFNPAAERIFGYPAAEIVRQNVRRLIREEDNGSGANGWAEGADGQTWAGGREMVARRKDGTRFPVLLSIGEAVVDNKRLYTGIIRDLTQEKKAREELGRHLKKQKEQNWFKSQLSRIYDSSQGITDPRQFCKTMLSELGEQLELGQALFYCLEEPDRCEAELRLYAAYGYSDPDSLRQTFRLEEGLVGECAHQQKPIVLSSVPEGYLRISSGLGNHPPREIMLRPILFKRHLLGVLEFAIFKEFTPVQHEYLDQVILTIGAILKGVMEQKRTEELLLVTQEQSEGLRVQQEELRVSNEELKRQTDQLQASEEELRVQQVELAEANSQLKSNARNLEERNEMLNARNEELELAREAIRLKAEELENASKYKSEFLANMSHELRTPLNSILVLANLLRENKQKTLDAKQEKFAGVIHQSGNDLLNLINEILDLSKIEAGMLELECADVPVAEIAQDIDDLFGEVSRSKQLTFEIEVSEDCPETIFADKGRLEQVIKNLISNAFKFTPEGGRVELSIRAVADRSALRAEPLQDASTVVAMAVRDNGIGIPRDKLDAVFESFQQADGSTSRKYGGTGLGLSISRELVHQMGGEFQLASEEGKGSTFTVFLPIEGYQPASQGGNSKTSEAAETEPASPRLPEIPASSNGHRIPSPTRQNGSQSLPDDRDRIVNGERVVLIVEDNLPFASVVLECARERGFKGIVAANGSEGMDFARQFRLEAILLDIELPAMDGWEVLRALKADEELASIPVHVMSALEKGDRALRLGAVQYLQKPVSSESLKLVFDQIQDSAFTPARKVLIIEDDENQNFAVGEVLRGRGYATSSAFSGKEAIERLAEEPIELVVLDLGLPDIPGMELLSRIRANSATEKIPIIVLTGREMGNEETLAIEQRGGSIILKTDNSDQRLLDETALCLRLLEEEGQVSKPAKNRVANSRKVLEGKTALLVDDDERNLSALSSLLEEHDMKIRLARTGREGIDAMASHPDIDIVLMDVMMPEMDGHQAIRTIRSQAGFGNVPIITVTAKAMKEDRAASLEAGASDYISKPIDSEKLLTLLSVWLYQ